MGIGPNSQQRRSSGGEAAFNDIVNSVDVAEVIECQNELPFNSHMTTKYRGREMK